MMPIALIPARGGSKRVPRKNIQLVDGIPMIGRAITTAIQSNLFSEVYVSTDNQEIAQIAEKFGALVPRLRSKELSDDFANTYDVVADFLTEAWISNAKPDHVCCLYPSSIFVKPSHLIRSYEILLEAECPYVFPVQEFSPPIQRGFQVTESGSVKMLQPEYLLARTQDLSPTFHDAGQFYWGKREAWEGKEPIFGPNSRVLICKPYEFIDIDTPEDLEMAVALFRART
jgi:pseudaminic acid cytidylyltransferase